jgi:transposase
VRVVDLFVEELDLSDLGFERTAPARTGRPGYHPAVLLKLFIYGYLNRVPSSRRLEREAGRNVELMWLTGRLAPTTRPSPISGATMALPSARPARSSSSSAVGSACCGAPASRSTAASSRR